MKCLVLLDFPHVKGRQGSPRASRGLRIHPAFSQFRRFGAELFGTNEVRILPGTVLLPAERFLSSTCLSGVA
eukprot:3723392-Pleurochrysis_carterae.AAC.7